MKITPSPLTAALAGAFSALLMPTIWARMSHDSMALVVAFLLVVALPAHALVVGFNRNPPPGPTSSGPTALDTALLKRIGAWLAAAGTALAAAWVIRT